MGQAHKISNNPHQTLGFGANHTQYHIPFIYQSFDGDNLELKILCEMSFTRALNWYSAAKSIPSV